MTSLLDLATGRANGSKGLQNTRGHLIGIESPATPLVPQSALRGTSKRIPARDRLSAGAWISVELATMRVPERAAVVESVRSLLSLGPDARAARTFDHTNWRYDPESLDTQSELMVRTLPPWYEGRRSLPRLRSAVDPRLPFTVFLGGDRAALCIDHRLGDGFLSVMLTSAVLAERGLPGAFLSADDRDPLGAALRSTFAKHPGRAREVLRDRLRQPRAVPAGGATKSIWGELPVLALETGVMQPAVFRSLVQWTRDRVPLTVAMIFALRRALEAEGIDVQDSGSILVDLRRYLPSGRATLANFVVGLPVPLDQGIEPAGTRFSHDLRVGRPLAALAAGLLRPSHSRLAARSIPLAASPTVSDMGFLRALEPLPWATDEPTVAVSVDPAARNGITALTSVLRRRLNVSLSFDALVHDPAKVEAACNRLCSDPIGLLP